MHYASVEAPDAAIVIYRLRPHAPWPDTQVMNFLHLQLECAPIQSMSMMNAA
jgi:hypothetical protein